MAGPTSPGVSTAPWRAQARPPVSWGPRDRAHRRRRRHRRDRGWGCRGGQSARRDTRQRERLPTSGPLQSLTVTVDVCYAQGAPASDTPAPRAPHLAGALQTTPDGGQTHPERGAFLDDRGQLGETDVHGEVPGLPGERAEDARWAPPTGPTVGPWTARSSGCIWAGTSGLPSWTAGCLAPLASLLGTTGVENYSPDTQHRFPEVLRGLDGHREGGLACSGLHTACCASPSFPNRERTATELQQPGPDPHCHRPAWRLLRAGPNPGGVVSSPQLPILMQKSSPEWLCLLMRRRRADWPCSRKPWGQASGPRPFWPRGPVLL